MNRALFERWFLGAWIVLLGMLLTACAPTEKAQMRYFWPLPFPGVAPKIEYVGFYQADKDLKRRDSPDWAEIYILGEYLPVPLFAAPFGVASFSNGQSIAVSDTRRGTVVVLDLQGKEVRELKNQAGETQPFMLPLGVASSASGEIFVVDALRSKVLKFGTDERLIDEFGDNSLLSHPVGIAVDDQTEFVLVTDAGQHNVAVFDFQGNLLYKFGERGDAPGEFNYPVDIDTDNQGNIYVLDSLNFRVQVLDSTGNFIRQFGEQGTEEGSFRIPKGLAVSPQKHVYVTDALSHKLVIFDNQGDYLLTLGDKYPVSKTERIVPGGFFMPRHVHVDRESRIWVVDGLNKILHRFQYLTPSYLENHPISEESVYYPPGIHSGK